MDFSEIKEIKADATISFGPNCRGAEALRRNKLRFFSGPFDWMMKYDLKSVFDALKNKGEGFFSDFIQDGEDRKKKFRYMVSKSTGMVSMHHFRNNLPVDEAYYVFKNTMKRRFKELDKIFNDAETLVIITSRKQETAEIIPFIKDFLTLYEFQKLYFINIFDSPEEKIEKEEFNNVTIYNCFFKDVHPDGSDPNINKKFWKGNMEYWDMILSKISLNKEFIRKYRIHKFLSNLFKKDLKTSLKLFYINSKCKLFRTFKIKAD